MKNDKIFRMDNDFNSKEKKIEDNSNFENINSFNNNLKSYQENIQSFNKTLNNFCYSS